MNTKIIFYINFLGILIASSILFGAYYYQFGLHEYPCPLCLLQRVAFFGLALGLFMNLRFGLKPLHYGLSILSCVIGMLLSGRQVLMHICPKPGDFGYGGTAFGMHLYTWACIAFFVAIIVIGFLFFFNKQFEEKTNNTFIASRQGKLLAKIAFIILFILAGTNAFFAFFECGFGFCPSDPDSYMILNGQWW